MVCRRSAHNVLLLGPPGAGTLMLARLLTTMLPAMTLAKALETTRLHSVAGLTGDRTALVTTRPFRAQHHPISDSGGSVGARCRCRARCRWHTTASSSWMGCRSSGGMGSRSCASRSRTASYTYNFTHVINLCDLVGLATRLQTESRSGGVH